MNVYVFIQFQQKKDADRGTAQVVYTRPQYFKMSGSFYILSIF